MLTGVGLLLGGCPDPALTSNPSTTPEDGPVVVSICYPPGVTDMETETIPIAVEACAAAGVPVARPLQWKRTFFLNDCPLFKIMRVAYICQPDPSAAAPLAPSEETAPATGPVEAPDPLTGNQES